MPDSLGLSKGLVAIAHLYADDGARGGNQVVIAHELLHTLGATDKYERATGQPLVPDGLGDPDAAAALSAALRRDHGGPHRHGRRARP